MNTTLISFIGTGRRRFDDGKTVYERTAYQFPSGKTSETSVFFNAILESDEYPVTNAVIIGTRSSEWATLLDRNEFLENDEAIELYERMLSEGSPVSDEVLEILAHVLSMLWSLPVELLAHAEDIGNENAMNIIGQYFETITRNKTDGLIIDITHGFRTMPVMLMSALEIRNSLSGDDRPVQIIYGEYNKVGKSVVRELDAIGAASVTARAIRRFFQSWDGEMLSGLLEHDWPEGSKAIRRLGTQIQGNLLLSTQDTFRQLSNSIVAARLKIDSIPYWIRALLPDLKMIADRYSGDDSAEKLLFFVKDFLQRGLLGQAIIALDAAFGAIATRIAGIAGDKFNEVEKARELLIKDSRISPSDRKILRNMETVRNSIAHSGGKTPKKSYPDEDSLCSLCRNGMEVMKRLDEQKTHMQRR